MPSTRNKLKMASHAGTPQVHICYYCFHLSIKLSKAICKGKEIYPVEGPSIGTYTFIPLIAHRTWSANNRESLFLMEKYDYVFEK